VRALNEAGPAGCCASRFDRHGTPQLEPVAGGLDRALGELFAIIHDAASTGPGSAEVCGDDGCRWAFYDHFPNRSLQLVQHGVLRQSRKGSKLPRRHSSAAGAAAGASRPKPA